MKRFKSVSRLMSVFLVSVMIAGMVQISLPVKVGATTSENAVTKASIESANDLLLYPAPRSLTAQDGEYILADGYIESDDASLKAIDKIYQDALDLTGVNLKDDTALRVIKIEKDDTLNEQGYSLFIGSDGIKITYKDEAGAYYAAATLRQILWQAKTNLPYLSIENDYPDFKYRAFDMDISRNRIPTLETLKSVVDTMADLKYNQFFLYLEGYSYAYESYPEAWKKAVPLTPQDIAELTEYADERGIELIPAQNSLGHSAKVVSTYPELGDTSSGQVLNVFKSDTQEYLSNIYDDLYTSFSTDYLQVGGDETTFNLTNGTAAASWKELNPGKEPTNEDVYIDSMKILYDLSKKKNKTMLYWSDMIVKYEIYDKAKEIMPDAIAMNWCYYAGAAGLTRFDYSSKGLSQAGIPFYVCPGDQSWSTIVGNTSELQANAQNAAKKGKQYGAIGYCMTNWGDGGHYQNLITTYPGLAYAGGLSWCSDTNTNDVNSYDEFLNMFVYRDATNTVSQAFTKIAKYKTDSGLSGDIPKCMMNDTWNSLNSSSFLWKVMNTNGDTTIDVSERDALIAKCQQVSQDITDFLDVLSKSDIQANNGELLYKEFKNTAQTLKITIDYMAMRAKLLTGGSIKEPLSTMYELSDEIIESSKEFAEVVEDFKYIWGKRDLANNLSSTLLQFRNISTFFKSKIGITNVYDGQEDGNLFLMTPDTIGTIPSASGGIAGNKTWSNSGIYAPAVTVSQIGNTTVEQLKRVFSSNTLSIADGFDNADEKVFIYDTGAAINGGFYDAGTNSEKLLPILGFPAVIPAEGVYAFTVKAKYKSGQAINADTVKMSGYANRISNSNNVMNIGENSELSVSGPDANGWYDVSFKFNLADCEAASINLIPVGSVTNDTLYVADYMLKCEEISKVVISSFYDKSSTAYIGTALTVPKATTNGSEEIVVTVKNPTGAEAEVNIGDSLDIEEEGEYILTYTAADADNSLVLTISAEYAYQDLLDTVNKIEKMDLSIYTDETVKALNAELAEAKALIADKTSDREVLDAAMVNLEKAMDALVLKRVFVASDKITVTSNVGIYQTYSLKNCIDGDLDTYTYLNDFQTVDDYIRFEFSEPVKLDGVQIINNAGNDFLVQGELQVSTDGEEWIPLGSVANKADQTIDFEAIEVSYARIICTKDARLWWKLSEAIFYIHVPKPTDDNNYIVSGMSIIKAKTEDKYGNSYDSTYPMSNVIDGDTTTMGANAYYFTSGAASKSLTVIDLGANYELKAVEIKLPSADQIATAFNAVSPASTNKKMNDNGSGIYVSNSVPAYSDFSDFGIASGSTAIDLVRLDVGGDKLSYGNWDPEARGTGTCNLLEEGKTYRYLSIWTPFGGGHALNEIKVKVEGAAYIPKSYIEAKVRKTANTEYSVEVASYNLNDAKNFIVAGYNDDVLVYFSTFEFGKGSADFSVTENIDEIKVMVWKDFSDLNPMCEANVVPESEFITE